MKKIVVPILSVIVMVAGLFGIDKWTAPIIAENEAASASGELMEMLEGATGFEEIDLATLADVSPYVKSVNKETSGKGYVIALSTSEGYTHEPIEFLISVDAEGKIAKTKLQAYPESRDFGEEYPLSYIGQDSALADVQLVAGVTFSSSAFKGAVEGAFNTLIANDMIKAGVKGDDQILTEMILDVHTGLGARQESDGNVKYNAKYTDMGDLGGNIVAGYKANNGSGCAFIANAGDKMVLVVTNVAGDAKAVDTEGNDVTDKVDAAVIDECKAASAKVTKTYEKYEASLGKKVSDTATVESIELKGIFSEVVAGAKIVDGDQTYYGFTSRTYGFDDEEMMEIFVIFDEAGAIFKMNATTYIMEEEYFSNYQKMDVSEYVNGFEGKTEADYSHDVAVIATATISTNAVDAGVRAAFEAFKAVK